jgi:hypothetical protein
MQAHHRVAPPLWPCHQVVWAPSPPSDIALPPIKSLEYYRGSINRPVMHIGVWRFVEEVNMAERSKMGVAQVYPASDPAAMAEFDVLL